MKKVFLLCCILLAICTPAQSDVIEATPDTNCIYYGDGYFYDEVSKLTWMDVTTYLDYTINEVEVELTGTDFKIATVEQVQALKASTDGQPWSEKAAVMGYTTHSQYGNIIWAACDDPTSEVMEGEAIAVEYPDPNSYWQSKDFYIWWNPGYMPRDARNDDWGVFVVLDENFSPTCSTPPEATQEIIDEIVEMIDLGDLKERYENRLLNDLEDAIVLIEKGNISAAVDKLNTFIKKIKNLIKRGEIDPEEGGDLIAAAEAIIDQLLNP